MQSPMGCLFTYEDDCKFVCCVVRRIIKQMSNAYSTVVLSSNFLNNVVLKKS